jgi:preprotein translocase subunit SecG
MDNDDNSNRNRNLAIAIGVVLVAAAAVIIYFVLQPEPDNNNNNGNPNQNNPDTGPANTLVYILVPAGVLFLVGFVVVVSRLQKKSGKRVENTPKRQQSDSRKDKEDTSPAMSERSTAEFSTVASELTTDSATVATEQSADSATVESEPTRDSSTVASKSRSSVLSNNGKPEKLTVEQSRRLQQMRLDLLLKNNGKMKKNDRDKAFEELMKKEFGDKFQVDALPRGIMGSASTPAADFGTDEYYYQQQVEYLFNIENSDKIGASAYEDRLAEERFIRNMKDPKYRARIKNAAPKEDFKAFENKEKEIEKGSVEKDYNRLAKILKDVDKIEEEHEPGSHMTDFLQSNNLIYARQLWMKNKKFNKYPGRDKDIEERLMSKHLRVRPSTSGPELLEYAKWRIKDRGLKSQLAKNLLKVKTYEAGVKLLEKESKKLEKESKKVLTEEQIKTYNEARDTFFDLVDYQKRFNIENEEKLESWKEKTKTWKSEIAKRFQNVLSAEEAISFITNEIKLISKDMTAEKEYSELKKLYQLITEKKLEGYDEAFKAFSNAQQNIKNMKGELAEKLRGSKNFKEAQEIIQQEGSKPFDNENDAKEFADTVEAFTGEKVKIITK